MIAGATWPGRRAWVSRISSMEYRGMTTGPPARPRSMISATLEEFLEARELLEVPAARLAAERRSDDSLHAIHQTIPGAPLRLNTSTQFEYNRSFHSAIVEAAANTLVLIAAQPIFSVLQTNLARARLGEEFHRTINQHHREIADAIERQDGDAAEELMRLHLRHIQPYYERAWKHAKREALG
jgi:DNA-binding FadR family transcriptional regulator